MVKYTDFCVVLFYSHVEVHCMKGTFHPNPVSFLNHFQCHILKYIPWCIYMVSSITLLVLLVWSYNMILKLQCIIFLNVYKNCDFSALKEGMASACNTCNKPLYNRELYATYCAPSVLSALWLACNVQ
jgi:hypothetical protein